LLLLTVTSPLPWQPLLLLLVVAVRIVEQWIEAATPPFRRRRIPIRRPAIRLARIARESPQASNDVIGGGPRDVTPGLLRDSADVAGGIPLTSPAPVQSHSLAPAVVHRHHVTRHDDDVTDEAEVTSPKRATNLECRVIGRDDDINSVSLNPVGVAAPMKYNFGSIVETAQCQRWLPCADSDTESTRFHCADTAMAPLNDVHKLSLLLSRILCLVAI